MIKSILLRVFCDDGLGGRAVFGLDDFGLFSSNFQWIPPALMNPSSPEVEKGHEAVTESGVSQAILAEHTAIQCYPGVVIISVPGC